MSARRRSEHSRADDLANVPFLDEEERAESEWLLARESDPAAPSPSPKLVSDHDELEDLLGSLPTELPDQRWYDEVLQRASSSGSAAPPRPWGRRRVLGWGVGGALVAAAAVVVVLLIPRGPELEVAIRPLGATRRAFDEVVVGDRLVVKARLPGPGELRIYRSGGSLVARCPGDARCTAPDHGGQAIELTLDAPVQYQVILVVGATDLPLGGTLDADLDAARAAHARIVVHDPIDVQ